MYIDLTLQRHLQPLNTPDNLTPEDAKKFADKIMAKVSYFDYEAKTSREGGRIE